MPKPLPSRPGGGEGGVGGPGGPPDPRPLLCPPHPLHAPLLSLPPPRLQLRRQVQVCLSPCPQDLEVGEAGSGALEALQIRVLYSAPLTLSMRPCSHFLRHACNFADKCKYSHGELVSFADLLEFEDPDFESLEKGSHCLVKKSELWEMGTITSISQEENRCAVKLAQTGKEDAFDFEDLLPIEVDEESGSESSNLYPAEPIPSATTQWNPKLHTANRPLGGWEEHTKGIGSKLMAQMGYVLGSGLGREGEGIVNPVQARLVPKGASLDHIMDAREARRLEPNSAKAIRIRRRQEKKEKIKAAKLAEGGLRNAVECGVFDFLNAQLAKGTKAKPKTLKTAKLKATSSRDLSVKLLEAEMKEKQARIEIVKCKEAIKRNEGRDEKIANQQRQKMAGLESYIAELNAKTTRITNEQSQRHDKKKLSIF